jgi:pimeloyl-ACP methyl ester carboxylesterase
MAGDMAGLLERLETGPVHVVGISMGGTLALQLALDFPELVDRLVLVNTFARLRPERPSVWLYFALRFVLVHTLGLPIQARAVARRIFPGPDQELLRRVLFEQICQADPKGYRAAMRALARFNVLRRLGEIHVPTLVITSELDGTVSPKTQRILVERIPNARQGVIPGAGHAVTAEQPEAFNRAMIDFLAEEARDL